MSTRYSLVNDSIDAHAKYSIFVPVVYAGHSGAERLADRAVPGGRGGQCGALRADVRRLRSGPGFRAHGAAAIGPAVRMAPGRQRPAAAVPPWAADHLCRAR